jgi:hypothetical protein
VTYLIAVIYGIAAILGLAIVAALLLDLRPGGREQADEPAEVCDHERQGL